MHGVYKPSKHFLYIEFVTNFNSIPLRDSLRPQMMQPRKIRQFPGDRCSDPIHKTTPQYASFPSV